MTSHANLLRATGSRQNGAVFMAGCVCESLTEGCEVRVLRGLTFELSRPWRRTPAGRGRTIYTMAWSGQTVAAVAGRRLSEGLGRTLAHACLPTEV